MSGKCAFKLPHSCGSSNGLQVYESDGDKYTGYCWACETYVPDPMGDSKDIPKDIKPAKTEQEILEEMEFISTLSSLDMPERQLSSKALDYYGIKIGLSEYDGKTKEFAYFPYTRGGKIVRYKVRLLPVKRMWSVGIDNLVDLFGWEQALATGSKKLIIVEGEWDAPALGKILRMHCPDQYIDNLPSVVSLPNGAGTAERDIARLLPEIRKYFSEVSLCFDNDEAGNLAVERVCKIAPDFTVISLPAKDANECLIKGLGKAAYAACTFRAKENKNTKLIWGRDLHETAKVPAQWGFSWPWGEVNKITKGIRLGETIYIGAGQKQGKSELVNQLASHFITEHRWPVLLIKPEEANNKTYKMVAGKIVGKKFHDPEVPFDIEEYERAGTYLKDNLAVINLYQNISFDVIKQDIQAAAYQGIKAVFIDPITNLVNGLDVAKQNTELQRIAQELSSLALDLNIVIFIFCHLRNPDSGLPHERGGEVLSSQFAGSRAMARSCNLMFGLEGNRDPSIPKTERNTKTLVLLEDREFGNTGKFKLYWDDNTTLFNEIRD